jgi:hypothetical protein
VDGSGGVGAVAVLDAAEIHDYHVALLDPPVARLVVRVGAVRARADDGEVDLAVAVLAQQRSEIGGDLVLRATGEADLDDLLKRRVGGGACGREALDLVGRP